MIFPYYDVLRLFNRRLSHAVAYPHGPERSVFPSPVPSSGSRQPSPSEPLGGDRPLRILVVANHAVDLIRFRGELLEAMRALGLDVHVALPRAPASVSRQLSAMGISYHEVPFERGGLNPFRDANTIIRLVRLCRRLRIDCVLNYTIKPVLYASLAARFAGVPNIYSVITGLGYAFVGDEWKRKILRGLVIRPFYRLALRLNTRVLFLNRDDAALFRSSQLLSASVPAEIIDGEGVDLRKFKPCAQPDTPSFLLIARLLVDKGIREYVGAARILKRQCPACRFRLVGWIDQSNPASISEEELAAWTSEGIIDYLGKLEDVRPAIADSSVYVLPSYREGMPVSILEAMAMGRPIITTDAPGCRETVVDGVNGLLVPVGDVETLADAMLRLARDPALSHAMGKESLSRARARYDVKKVTDDILTALALKPTTARKRVA